MSNTAENTSVLKCNGCVNGLIQTGFGFITLLVVVVKEKDILYITVQLVLLLNYINI